MCPTPNLASVSVPPIKPRGEEKLDGSGSGPCGDLELFADVDSSVLDELLQTFKKLDLMFGEIFSKNCPCILTALWNDEAASFGWGSGVDRSAMSSSHGNDVGWQWFRDPRRDSPSVESGNKTKEKNYLLWRIENEVAEGSTEIPKGTQKVQARDSNRCIHLNDPPLGKSECQVSCIGSTIVMENLSVSDRMGSICRVSYHDKPRLELQQF
ncbi:hypothetical protein D5086_015823 [Populus alba]|uniref:Uncharacterized protein n=1 Tax=Populus alba TaxID=43335 RepID=A0ACC4BTI4_POPAL